jgi:hypothetical protein
MHSLVAYSLEARLTREELEIRILRVREEISQWLKSKGAIDPEASEGRFESLTSEGEGYFTRILTSTEVGTLEEVELNETAHTGQIFTTAIQVVQRGEVATIYATLGVTSISNIVAPVRIYPKCPRVVRTLVDAYPDWTFGNQLVPQSRPADSRGAKLAGELCDEICSPARNFPIVAVSIDPDEIVWPELPYEMARDLVALAQVTVVDEAGSWTMTERLGGQNSCYLGAVRIYWPTKREFKSGVDLKAPTWTAAKQESFGQDEGGMKRFLSRVRSIVMSAAALTIAPPRAIREIQSAAVRQRLRDVESAVRDKELDSIVEENAKLLAELEESKRQIATLQWKVAHFREKSSSDDVDDEDLSGPEQPAHKAPVAGEVRYYKKIGTKAGVDTLVLTSACNHNESTWKPAFKNEQAKKGLMKLEGRSDWKTMEHCGGCTGGGRWRVRW